MDLISLYFSKPLKQKALCYHLDFWMQIKEPGQAYRAAIIIELNG